MHAYDTAGTGKLQAQTSVSLRRLIGVSEGGNPDAFVLEAFDGTSPQMSCPESAAASTAVTFTRDLPAHDTCVGLELSKENSAPLEP